MTGQTIGVDISKAHLDVFQLEDGAAQRFEISAARFRALIKWRGKALVARTVFEPMGPPHKAFKTALGEAFRLIKVNPLQARSDPRYCDPETSNEGTARPSRQSNCRTGHRNHRTDLSARNHRAQPRYSLLNARDRRHHGRRHADPVARNRYARAQTGGQPDRSCPHHPTIRFSAIEGNRLPASGSVAGKIIQRGGRAPCATRYTCPHASPCGSTQTLRPNTKTCVPLENPQRLP